MANLDQELEQAISDSEREAQERGVTAEPGGAGTGGGSNGAPANQRPGARRKNWGLLVALLAVAGGILALVFTSAEDAAIYSVTTDQLRREASKYEGRNVRVEGNLVKGSLRHRAEPCEYRFEMEKNGASVPVRYPECIVPDTFRDMPGMDVMVTAEGKWNAEGYFEASHIMAKCPSKYEMEQKAKRGEAAPHAAVGTPNAAPTL
ncbi:MAG TPA: cytochrome c maturation protein CcmE [Polyangiaceae bacterium]|nr:cytochrome c maturation protein CcmE [Polyangiaceae bacterium]